MSEILREDRRIAVIVSDIVEIMNLFKMALSGQDSPVQGAGALIWLPCPSSGPVSAMGIVMVYVKLASEIQLLKFQLNFSEISIADPELLEICKLEVRVVTL